MICGVCFFSLWIIQNDNNHVSLWEKLGHRFSCCYKYKSMSLLGALNMRVWAYLLLLIPIASVSVIVAEYWNSGIQDPTKLYPANIDPLPFLHLWLVCRTKKYLLFGRTNFIFQIIQLFRKNTGWSYYPDKVDLLLQMATKCQVIWIIK